MKRGQRQAKVNPASNRIPMEPKPRSKIGGTRRRRIRYAVVGLGHIAQEAVLPAFANAKRNSELAVLISDDARKLEELSRRYSVAQTCGYDDYDACMRSGDLDAVYITLPNHLHCNFAVRAAKAGVHVLCEKPLALDEDECHKMIQACAENGVALMTAYRLHFERANLEAIRQVQSGKIGDPRIFQSLFTMQVQNGNIRLQRELGGGTLYDTGIYCINAARYLFRAEPTEVFGFSANSGDPRFHEVDEMTSAVLRFPEGRLASFTSSFGAADIGEYVVIGTRGRLRMTNAYEYSESIEMEVTVDGKTTKRTYGRRDQFAPELVYFSDCILHRRDPEPSGIEGLLDVRIIGSIYESAKRGTAVRLKDLQRGRRPSVRQEIYRPPPAKPIHVDVSGPSR
jgi:predicted dehydrogenase